ncbi:TetR/AcrR family transcriptional regulator [Frigoribacterium sp. CG_9.8]|uniref:TetR/AcrR family transcriptional regulator n=1 Tax=Frigoribacterium sp. CG_9.8 TaxID=2787733 RepID=UPI0018C902B3|nr:TetR/AcrR family transcriptional regulator [Frigoribacterium sp. CG_9.8]MBG6106460.1 AcrR family transcriptional regulator [Frigoribacterium sp. CG_9.8]
MTASTTPDRRAALKARHRAAILAAAHDLVQEHGGPRFNVDELAARADVARRTVFNHFASVDEVLLALSADVLDVIIDEFIGAVASSPVGDGSRSSMFTELAETLRHVDLPSVIASVAGILGGPDGDDARGRALTNETFTRAAERLLHEVARRYPEADTLDTEVLVGSLMNGLVVIAKRWLGQSCDRTVDAAARADWDHLLARLTDTVRRGYLPAV